MKKLIHLTVLIAVLLIPTGCARRETWDYLVMGVMSRAENFRNLWKRKGRRAES